jgi:hypothetical protein
MMAQCLLMLAVGLCDSGGDTQAETGQVQWEFSVPSRWALVEGWKGNVAIRRAGVSFHRSGMVTIGWHVETENRAWGAVWTRPYCMIPEFGLPVLSGRLPRHLTGRTAPTFRMVGDALELKIPDLGFNDPDLPPGAMRLILKRVP